MKGKFRVQSLEIEGFRGINEKKVFRFDLPFVLLFGNNGRGKSSTLGAIEWSLFGDFVSVRCIESKTKDELVNSVTPKATARVTLTLQRNGESYTFTREKVVGKRKTKFSVKTPDGEFKNSEAEAKVESLLGLTLDDFHRTVFLHQEAVRGLLTDDSSRRDEAMDRLFGLDKLRNIIDAVHIASVRTRLRDLGTEKDKLEERVKGAVHEKGEEISRLRKEALEEHGLSRSDITLKNGLSTARAAITDLKKVLKQHSFPEREFPVPKALPELKSFVSTGRSVISSCRRSMPEISKVSELRSNQTNLEELRDENRGQQKQVRSVRSEISKLVRRFGAEKKISGSLERKKSEIEGLKLKRRQTDVKARLLHDALEYLEVADGNTCPVCHQKIKPKELVSELRRHVKERRDALVQQINQGIKKLTAELDELGGVQTKLKRLNDEMREGTDSLRSAEMRICEKLGLPHKERKKALTKISSEIVEVRKEISRLESAIRTRQRSLEVVEAKIERARMIHNILTKEGELENIRATFSEEEAKKKLLGAQIHELRSLEDDLSKILAAMARCQKTLAENVIKKSAASVSRYYSRLCGHPYYDHLQVQVIPKEFKGQVKNAYLIKAFNRPEKKETLVSTRFSVGQMNCVALSIYLSLSRILSHRLGFLIMDDPSQSLDADHQQALVEVLKNINHDTQIVLSTHDRQFKNFVVSSMKPRGGRCLYNFSSWTKKGPVFTLSS